MIALLHLYGLFAKISFFVLLVLFCYILRTEIGNLKNDFVFYWQKHTLGSYALLALALITALVFIALALFAVAVLSLIWPGSDYFAWRAARKSWRTARRKRQNVQANWVVPLDDLAGLDDL